MKKAQGLSINAIILSALGVLVLVILVGVFSGSMGKTNKNIQKNIEGAGSVMNMLSALGITIEELSADTLKAVFDVIQSKTYSDVSALCEEAKRDIKSKLIEKNLPVGNFEVYPVITNTGNTNVCPEPPNKDNCVLVEGNVPNTQVNISKPGTGGVVLVKVPQKGFKYYLCPK